METFDNLVQIEEPVSISGTTEPINIKSFFQDTNKSVSLYYCKGLKEILDIILTEGEEVTFNSCELFLPVNKKTLPVDEIVTLIKDTVINLTSFEGRGEARRRFGILAQRLSLESSTDYQGRRALHRGGCGIHIGDFKFADGSLKHVFTHYKSDQGENGAWWFGMFENDRFEMNPSYWFSFSTELHAMINSSAFMS